MEMAVINGFNTNQTFIHLSDNYCIKGTIMADRGMLKEALENFNKAIESNPGNHVAYFNRATIKIDLGDLEGAKNDFENFDMLTKNVVTKVKGLL